MIIIINILIKFIELNSTINNNWILSFVATTHIGN